MQGIMTNGITPRVLFDLVKECETLMNHITVQIKTLDQAAVTKWLNSFFAPKDEKNARSIEAMRALYKQSPRDFEIFLKDRQNFVRRLSKKWQESGIEALVSPVFPHCSFKNELAAEMNIMREYTRFWNTACFPAGVIPVTRVREDEQSFTDKFNDNWTELLKKNSEDSVGMPICLQIIAHA